MKISKKQREYLKKKYGNNRSKNPDYLKEYSDIWNTENKDKLKNYYKENRTKILKNTKKRYKKNSKTDRELCECPCGSIFIGYNENRHLMSSLHAKKMIKLDD
jgi:hypothetical protein